MAKPTERCSSCRFYDEPQDGPHCRVCRRMDPTLPKSQWRAKIPRAPKLPGEGLDELLAEFSSQGEDGPAYREGLTDQGHAKNIKSKMRELDDAIHAARVEGIEVEVSQEYIKRLNGSVTASGNTMLAMSRRIV